MINRPICNLHFDTDLLDKKIVIVTHVIDESNKVSLFPGSTISLYTGDFLFLTH